MKMATKIWLIIGAALVGGGLTIFTAVMTQYGWNFMKLGTQTCETNIYEIGEEFSNVSLDTDTADIQFALSDDGKCRVECFEREKEKLFVGVENGTLIIKETDERSWYDHIGINFASPKIKVYLPKAEYAALAIKASTGDIEIAKDFKFEGSEISVSTGDINFFASASGIIKIKTSTGKIFVENISAEALELSASTGDITVFNVVCQGDVKTKITTGKTKLTDMECKNFTSKGTTGKVFLENVVAREKFSIKRSTGDVIFKDSDAAEIFVKTSTGDVKGSLLTDKVFVTHTNTGSVDVPKTVDGGKCEIHTTTGDVKIN